MSSHLPSSSGGPPAPLDLFRGEAESAIRRSFTPVEAAESVRRTDRAVGSPDCGRAGQEPPSYLSHRHDISAQIAHILILFSTSSFDFASIFSLL